MIWGYHYFRKHPHTFTMYNGIGCDFFRSWHEVIGEEKKSQSMKKPAFLHSKWIIRKQSYINIHYIIRWFKSYIILYIHRDTHTLIRAIDASTVPSIPPVFSKCSPFFCLNLPLSPADALNGFHGWSSHTQKFRPTWKTGIPYSIKARGDSTGDISVVLTDFCFTLKWSAWRFSMFFFSRKWLDVKMDESSSPYSCCCQHPD